VKFIPPLVKRGYSGKIIKTQEIIHVEENMANDTRSTENLRTAFAAESQANRKYLAFAMQAETEGFRQVAKLFRATAEAETVHAHNHLRTLKGVVPPARTSWRPLPLKLTSSKRCIRP
jgi:rubrerythrin